MTDLLLINTSISRKRRNLKSRESVPPIGLGYIYTQLIHAGFSCEFVDAELDGHLPLEVAGIINRSQAKYIGLNVFSSNFDIVRDLVQNAEPPREFLLGGPAARALSSEIKSWNLCGSITLVTGEAELVVPDILQRLIQAKDHRPKLNIIDVGHNSPFYPSNIDIPLDRSIFKNEPIYRSDLNLIESHIITSRGCVYDCAYCTAARSCNPEQKPRFRTFESLFEEVQGILKIHPETNCIRILDDLFLRSPASIELAKKLFPVNKLFWRSMAHVNTFKTLPSGLLSDIKMSGCKEVFIGLESGNDKTLEHIRKPFSVDTAYKTVCRILDAGIPVKCYFILGFPGETKSEACDTVSFASRLKEYAENKSVQLRVSPFRFRPYHGTALYDELVKRGWTIGQIQNRNDMLDTDEFNHYDCVSGHYADYDDKILDRYMKQMEKLN